MVSLKRKIANLQSYISRIDIHITKVENAIHIGDFHVLGHYRTEYNNFTSQAESILILLNNHDSVLELKTKYFEAKKKLDSLLTQYGK